LTYPASLVSLSTSDELVATIASGDDIQGVAPGTATISASLMGREASDAIDVLPAP
jgi:hypothetical protein